MPRTSSYLKRNTENLSGSASTFASAVVTCGVSERHPVGICKPSSYSLPVLSHVVFFLTPLYALKLKCHYVTLSIYFQPVHSLLYISPFFLLFLEVSLVLHFILWLTPLSTWNLLSLVCCNTWWLTYNLFKWCLCTSKNYFQLNTFVKFITICMLSNFPDLETIWDFNLDQSSTFSSSSLLTLNICFTCFSTKNLPLNTTWQKLSVELVDRS